MKQLITIALLVPFLSFSQTAETDKGIRFEHLAFSELLAKAKKENKMIFIDAYTTWCGPCKWMVKNVFPNDTAAAYYNKNFINAKIDMEKGEGIGLAKKYQVSCYPTYLFIDGNGQLIHRTSSAMPVKEFVQLGTTAMDPAKQFSAFQKKYNSGGMSPEEMGEFVLMKSRSCLPAKEETAKYFSTQSEADLTSKKNWEIFFTSDININSREFKYLIEHRVEYEKTFDPKMVNSVIESSYYRALQQFVKVKDTDGYKKLKFEILEKAFSFSEQMVLSADIDFFEATEDWTDYAQSAVKFIDKYGKDDYNRLNNMAWGFYEHVTDRAMLLKAEEWSKRSVELNPGYFNYDTYAAVLVKLGKKTEALAAAEMAIELAKKSGDDYKETSLMLEKIKALK